MLCIWSESFTLPSFEPALSFPEKASWGALSAVPLEVASEQVGRHLDHNRRQRIFFRGSCNKRQSNPKLHKDHRLNHLDR